MRTEVEEIFHQVVDLSAEARAHYFTEHEIDTEMSRAIEDLIGFDASSSIALKHAIGALAERTLERFEPEGMLCGAYRLGTPLGRGGMGRVYLAERVDGEVAQRVAVKLLRGAADDPELRDRFLAERQILAGLSHPNIARLLDAGHRDDGQPYLVMEHVAGKPVDVYAAGFGISRKISLFIKVCAAVGYLHRNLVVHRDLKPANILVTEEGEPKLLDFGIAKILDLTTDSTVTSLRILTPDYASPEQIAGSRVTTASDIYSLGAVLYKLLTGSSPHRFEGNTQGAIDWEAGIENITPPAKLVPALHGDLELILMKALRKEPQERYATIEQFSEDLGCYLDSRPIRARPSDFLYRTLKFVRRHWLPVAALFFALSSLTTGLVLAQRQRDASVRRFNEVRQLAKQLFTIEKDIRTLPGSTLARERIVKIALQYLERLSNEAGNDPTLRAELASAYTEVANIQGGFRTMNLGHPNEALVSLQRAERFFREVCEAKPDDAPALRAYIEAVESRSRIKYSEMNDELVAPGNVDEFDSLGGLHESMSLAAGRFDLRKDGLEQASKSVDFRRNAASSAHIGEFVWRSGLLRQDALTGGCGRRRSISQRRTPIQLPSSPRMASEEAARAEADWALESGKPPQAADIRQAWLERTPRDKERPAGPTQRAHVFSPLAITKRSLPKERKTEPWGWVGKREREILEFWKKTVPDSSRIAWPWLHRRG